MQGGNISFSRIQKTIAYDVLLGDIIYEILSKANCNHTSKIGKKLSQRVFKFDCFGSIKEINKGIALLGSKIYLSVYDEFIAPWKMQNNCIRLV